MGYGKGGRELFSSVTLVRKLRGGENGFGADLPCPMWLSLQCYQKAGCDDF